MTYKSLHVLIIGAGLGGLCLAQGLRQAGIDVTVYERDRTPTDREQGYRIHLDPVGSRSLYECLPPQLYRLFLQTSGSAGKGFAFLDEQLRELLFITGENANGNHGPRENLPRGNTPDGQYSIESHIESHKSVSRTVLRGILLRGLEEVVHFDKTFTHYTQHTGGRVTAHFEDGTSATGDLLVGADGGNSRVRQGFLPHARRIETGVVGIMGKVPLGAETQALLPSGRFDIAGIVLGPRGRNVFLARHEFNHAPSAADAPVGKPDFLFDDTRSYIMWGLLDHRTRIDWPADPFQLSGVTLQTVAADALRGWHSNLHALVRRTDPETVLCTSIRTSVPVEPWTPRPITLVGDAIHSMTPLRGMGGNTALRDAALLCANLQQVQQGKMTLLEAVGAYEAEMRQYGFAAVRQSRQTLDMLFRANPWGRMVLKGALRTVDRFLRWKNG